MEIVIQAQKIKRIDIHCIRLECQALNKSKMSKNKIATTTMEKTTETNRRSFGTSISIDVYPAHLRYHVLPPNCTSIRVQWDFKNVIGFNITFWLLKKLMSMAFLSCYMKSRRMCACFYLPHRPNGFSFYVFPIIGNEMLRNSWQCFTFFFLVCNCEFRLKTNGKTNNTKTAQHLLRLMRLMTIIDCTNKWPIQCEQMYEDSIFINKFYDVQF